ncbi:hypothetical protein CYJ76_02730 [Kytococcus schroeteri]|uniref:Biotin synthase auxiliary protein n=1 Tax=Kytococcus schroeteri TaxID=138300 RepID=A0A2I1PD05_9MICO|nr:hypothetical protein CYJ76_02730 [Kytococcus schroeteri]
MAGGGRGADAGAATPDAHAVHPTYCGHCGEPLADAGHDTCTRRLELEPPRYCPACRRRMVVQVTPRGWTASCSRHGVTTA